MLNFIFGLFGSLLSLIISVIGLLCFSFNYQMVILMPKKKEIIIFNAHTVIKVLISNKPSLIRMSQEIKRK